MSFIESLTKRVKDKYKIKGDLAIDFYYMTLYGDNAQSSKFKTVKWVDFILDTFDEQLSFPFNILFDDMKSRALELKSFINMPISPEKNFTEYYSCINRWVDSKTVMLKYFMPILKNIEQSYNGQVEISIGKLASRSPQLLIQLALPHWRKNSLNNYIKNSPIDKFEKTMNMHVEFSWAIGSNNATLYIHYETNPYFPAKELHNKFPEIEAGYYSNREKYKTAIQKVLNNTQTRIGREYWKVTNTKLAIAKAYCNDFMNQPFSQVKDWFENAFKIAYSSINSAIESIE